MLKIFIQRPVLSTVISLLVVLLGALGMMNLPIAQYPDIAPPTVQVTATYAGANASVVLNTVIIPLEQKINGVENMTYMTSTANDQGSATISVFFATGTDPNIAAVDVQNRVALATGKLPATVTETGVSVTKQQSSNVLIISLYGDKPGYDQTFLQNYAAINVTPLLARVKGVGSAAVFGSSMTYSMRIWLKPDVMSVYGVTPADITAALAEQNVEAAPGQFGANNNQSFTYVIGYTGELQSIQDFDQIVLKSIGKGQYLRLKDVARIELGAQTYSGSTITNGKQSVGISISQMPGSNASQVIKDCQAVMQQASSSFPAGVKFLYLVDINQFLDASISDVIRTLIECFGLVFLVIFIFLQDIRSTIIPGIAVPVAVIGTFFFLLVFGFSINLLTLFALILAIGIVVDDPIVVVEAVHAKLERGYTSPSKAAIDTMGEISSAIISITLVMASVFVPVTFISGSAGIFYKQFGITLAVAIMLSAINALTLCPALCALFLKPPKPEVKDEKKNFLERFGSAFNNGYEKLTEKYSAALSFLTARKWLVILAIAGFTAGLFLLMKSTPSSFVPDEDMGTVFVNISLPAAASMERVKVVANEVDSISRTIPQIQYTMRTLGTNLLAGTGSPYGLLIIRLIPWDKRPGVTYKDIIAQLSKKTAIIKDANIFPNILERLNIDFDSLKSHMIIADGIHNPPKTHFLREAESRGCVTIDGLQMLVNQGVIGIRYWTGTDVNPEVMRNELKKVLAIE